MYSVVILNILILGCSCSDLKFDYFSIDKRYNNVLPRSGILWSGSNHLPACLLDFQMDTECESVFYDNQQCHGYKTKLHYGIHTIDAHGMKNYENAGPVGNLAAGRPATQSSILGGVLFKASYAVDNRRYPFQNAGAALRSCSHTDNDDPTPFWQVDILSLHVITAVAFLDRIECCGSRNARLNITVAESSAGPYNQCYYYPPGPGYFNEMKTFYCTKPLTGRLVRISREEPVINACGVEVYGYPMILGGKIKNL